jgi:hypothetical protein
MPLLGTNGVSTSDGPPNSLPPPACGKKRQEPQDRQARRVARRVARVAPWAARLLLRHVDGDGLLCFHHDARTTAEAQP